MLAKLAEDLPVTDSSTQNLCILLNPPTLVKLCFIWESIINSIMPVFFEQQQNTMGNCTLGGSNSALRTI